MALDTEPKFDALLVAIADLGKEAIYNFGSDAVENLVALTNAIGALEGGDGKGAIGQLATALKTQHANLYESSLGNQFVALLEDYQASATLVNAKTIGWPSNHREVYDHFVTAGKTVQERAPVYDTVPTEAGVGDHTILRVTEDRFGQTIESAFLPIDITIEVLRDQANGLARFEEEFGFRAPQATNTLELSGRLPQFNSPILQALNRDGAFVKNASFQSGQSGGVAIADPVAGDFGANAQGEGGWTDPTGVYGSAKYSFDSVDTYRRAFEERAAANQIAVSLEIKGNHTLEQPLSGMVRGRPYIPWARVMRKTGCDATISLPYGLNTSASLDLTTIANDTFTLVVPTLDSGVFTRNWLADETKQRIVTTGLTTGTWKIDSMGFQEGIFFNGTWWFIIPGVTPALRTGMPKTYLFEDVLAGADAVIQRLIALLFGVYFPSSSTPSIVDP